MGKVKINNLKTYAYHGCLSEERKIGSEYIVNLSAIFDSSVSSESDNLTDTVDYVKLKSIILKEMKETLKRGERVELRGFGIWSTHIQKARISRNPKTGEKIQTPEKKTIHFKMAKELFNKLNNNE